MAVPARPVTPLTASCSEQPLLRATLIRVGPDEHAFALVMHHIIGDGESLALLLGDALAQLQDPARPRAALPAGMLKRYTETEQAYCEASPKNAAKHYAARFAAKEALAKALGSPGGMVWLDAEVVTSEQGQPEFVIRGTVAARAEALGVGNIRMSLSHDAGLATAFVVCEGKS